MSDKQAAEYRMVLVHWVDAHIPSAGWRSAGEAASAPLACSTIGFVIEDSEAFIALASTINDARQHMPAVTIPRSWVVTVSALFEMKRS